MRKKRHDLIAAGLFSQRVKDDLIAGIETGSRKIAIHPDFWRHPPQILFWDKSNSAAAGADGLGGISITARMKRPIAVANLSGVLIFVVQNREIRETVEYRDDDRDRHPKDILNTAYAGGRNFARMIFAELRDLNDAWAAITDDLLTGHFDTSVTEEP